MTISRRQRANRNHQEHDDSNRPSAPPIEMINDNEDPTNDDHHHSNENSGAPDPRDLGPPPSYEEAMRQESELLETDFLDESEIGGIMAANNRQSNDSSSIRDQTPTPRTPRSTSRNSNSRGGGLDSTQNVKDKKMGTKIKRGLEEFAFAIIQLLD